MNPNLYVPCFILYEPHQRQWCNVMVCMLISIVIGSGSTPNWVKPKTKIGICCFSALNRVLLVLQPWAWARGRMFVVRTENVPCGTLYKYKTTWSKEKPNFET